MLISISDSVSCEVSGTEAVAVAPECLSGDLNAENSLPYDVTSKKLEKTKSVQVCLLVLVTAACPDFVWVTLPYLVH